VGANGYVVDPDVIRSVAADANPVAVQRIPQHLTVVFDEQIRTAAFGLGRLGVDGTPPDDPSAAGPTSGL
jgi:hypothetical protein